MYDIYMCDMVCVEWCVVKVLVEWNSDATEYIVRYFQFGW